MLLLRQVGCSCVVNAFVLAQPALVAPSHAVAGSARSLVVLSGAPADAAVWLFGAAVLDMPPWSNLLCCLRLLSDLHVEMAFCTVDRCKQLVCGMRPL